LFLMYTPRVSKIFKDEVEHMIRMEVESQLRVLLPQIIKPMVKKVLDENKAIEFEEAFFKDF